LSGLASGFDWKPVVEQLIELERIPQKKLEREKDDNDTKISELGILKSQLETLKSSAEGLQNEDIYDARKVVLGEDTSDYLTASAEVGTLVGQYNVSIHSLGTNTILTSNTLKPNGVGQPLNILDKLKDLPLQTAITPGTFTVESQTYEITSADFTSLSLDDLLKSISADPENDGYSITFEYDPIEDRVIVDGNELNALAPGELPILGHPNDTSNFLKVMRLLDGAVVTRFADQDNFRVWDGSDPDNSESGVWLRAGDTNLSNSPTDSHGLPDRRNYTFFTDGKAYQRIDDGNQEFDPEVNGLVYQDAAAKGTGTGDVVYKDGVLYECIQSLPTERYFGQEGIPSVSDYYAAKWASPDPVQVTHDSNANAIADKVWELEYHPQDHINSTSMGASNDHAWTPSNDTELFKTDDVVYNIESGAKFFFQAIKDSVVTPANLPYADGTLYVGAEIVESTAGSGLFYEADASGWGNVSAEPPHVKGGGIRYMPGDLRIMPGDQTYEATANWGATPSELPDHSIQTGYNQGDLTWDSLGSTGAYKANFTLLSGFPATAIAVNDLVSTSSHTLAPDYQYFKAKTAFPDHVDGAPYLKDKLVYDPDTVKYWKATADTSDNPGASLDWLDVTPDVTVNFHSDYWDEVTGDVQNLTNPAYWDPVTFSEGHLWQPYNTDVTETAFWKQIAHINGIADFDVDYWNPIQPGSGQSSSGPFWKEIAYLGPSLGTDTDLGSGDLDGTEDPEGNTDTNFWRKFDIGDPTDTTYWKEVTESFITSSQALGSVDVSATLGNSNLGSITATGSFFIGDGAGAVEIAYDINVDTVTDLIERVNASDAKVTMSYDAIGDQFIVQSDLTGNLGITLNESDTWDNINTGSGNLLEMMGLAAPNHPAPYAAVHNPANPYSKGDYVTMRHMGGVPLTTLETFWQATEDISDGTVPGSDDKWEQVIQGVGRAQSENLGDNAIITINGGSRIFSQSNVFDEDAHGVQGLTINASKATDGEMSFVVERDNAPAKNAIDKFVTEFNDAQKYVSSLVAVTRTGDDVTVGRFSGNLEISRLGSQLRRIVFGSNYPHSASEVTNDGTNKTVADLDARNTLSENFDADNDGYRVYVTDETAGSQTDSLGTTHVGDESYQEWQSSDGKWHNFTPTFSAFRINDVGLDFRSGNDELYFKNSALLTQELTDNPNKVKALFSEEKPSSAVFDHNRDTKRDYGGLTYFLNEFIENFAENDSGTYKTHVESLQGQNDRLDEDIDDLERYLEQREETLSRSFIRMEEMQSRMNTQLQTLQNSFKK